MVRRVFYTMLALLLAGSAFCNADPQPDVNLFDVLFLFVAFVIWFCWSEIQAGYSYLEENRRVPGYESTGLMLIRLAPMYLRELTGQKRRKA
jgi:hypothetical protein